MAIRYLWYVVILAFVAALPVQSASAQDVQLGSISFLNTGESAAQADFIEGVLYLHSFEYESAANAFRRAQNVDHNFVLAYWGEAMTYNHTVWMQQDLEKALEALNRLDNTPEERSAKAGSARERDLLGAVEILYGTVAASAGKSKDDRDDLYSAEMHRLLMTYPEDLEIRAFYALSILGTAHEGRDFATYMKAAAAATPVWDANRDHPGAAHYLIHSYDDPVHAPLGLPMARAYSVIAPNAAHAQHMTSHIFVAMGLWDDVISANVVASRVSKELNEQRGRKESVCGHYTYWLEYGYLQADNFDKALEVFEACYARQSDSPTGSEIGYYASMRARVIFDMEDWSAAGRYVESAFESGAVDPDAQFSTAFAALKLGDPEKAEAYVSKVASTADPSEIEIMYRHQLQGLLAHASGQTGQAEAHLRAAADYEASLPFEYGPPTYVKPGFELLGEYYLATGENEKAAAAFAQQLDRTPMRAGSLAGHTSATGSRSDSGSN